MTEDDKPAKRLTLPRTVSAILLFVVAISFYLYVRLSNSPTSFAIFIAVLLVVEVAQIGLARRASVRVDAGLEIIFFVVMLLILFGLYRTPLISQPFFFLVTVFYRPSQLQYGNRAVAYFLSLMILVVVLPVTLAGVTDRHFLQASAMAYALLVGLLWVFCSQRGLTRV